MGILYLIIGQFLELPLFGVNLPGHLILSYVNDRFKLKDKKKYNSADVMFYVNPFNNGAVFTKSEIELYIKQLKISPKEKYYLPSNNISIIKRYLKELEKLYKLNKLDSKLSFIQRLSDLFYKY
jgi:regulator of sirC expression with transglutaminase-like and TPR domain